MLTSAPCPPAVHVPTQASNSVIYNKILVIVIALPQATATLGGRPVQRSLL